MKLQTLPAKHVYGPLGLAIQNNLERRIKRFVVDEKSEPIAMFSPEVRATSDSGDWYGEHAGKWLIAATRAWVRTGDAELAKSLEVVVSALLAYQEPNGYLGTYAKEAPCRLTSAFADSGRTWDVWIHAYMVLGLLEYWRATGNESVLTAANRIGDMLLGHANPDRLLRLGNHKGLSSLVVIEPLTALASATGNKAYAQFCLDVLDAASCAGVNLLTPSGSDCDVATIGTGKIYQILWCALGMLDLAELTGESQIYDSALRIIDDIDAYHLTPQGGPWGGIGTHKEVFNARHFFDPCGMVETCSSATWVAMLRRLYERTREETYLEMAQRTIWNSILGACGPDGESWIYFSFPNGRRNYTYHWACCKSSGMMALEEAALLCAHHDEDNVFVHATSPFSATTESGTLELHGLVEDRTWSVQANGFPQCVWMQRPSWICGGDEDEPWCVENGIWSMSFDIKVTWDHLMYTLDHHGQEIVREEYITVGYGPYSMAAELIDGFRKQDTLRIAQLFPGSAFSRPEPGHHSVSLNQAGRLPILLKPYYLAGQGEGGWRASWLEVAWQ